VVAAEQSLLRPDRFFLSFLGFLHPVVHGHFLIFFPLFMRALGFFFFFFSPQGPGYAGLSTFSPLQCFIRRSLRIAPLPGVHVPPPRLHRLSPGLPFLFAICVPSPFLNFSRPTSRMKPALICPPPCNLDTPLSWLSPNCVYRDV